MKIRRRETRGQLHTLCWFPNHRRAMRRRVSNPDCAVDARLQSRREQHPLLAAPSVLAENLDCALARLQALSRLHGRPILFRESFGVRQRYAAFGWARFFTPAGRSLLVLHTHIFHTQDAHALSIESPPSAHCIHTRLEKLLRNERGHKRTQYHDGHENRVLALIDQIVLQTEQRGNRAEGETGSHEESRVTRFAFVHPVHARQWKHADDFRRHFQNQKSTDEQKASPKRW